MKAELFVTCVVFGLEEGPNLRIVSTAVHLKADVNIPAMPRAGDEVRLGDIFGRHSLNCGEVERVYWCPVENRQNVFYPVIILKDIPWNDDAEREGCETLPKEIQHFKAAVKDSSGDGLITFIVQS